MIPVMLKHCKLSYIPSASGKNTKIEKVRVNATKKKNKPGPLKFPATFSRLQFTLPTSSCGFRRGADVFLTCNVPEGL